MTIASKTEPRTSLRGRFSNGVFWAIVGTSVSQGIGLLVAIVSARLLGKVQFGEYGILLSAIAMYGVLAGTWLGIGATKFLAEYRDAAPDRAGRIIAMSLSLAALSGLFFSSIVLAFAPYLSKSVLNAPHLTNELRVVAAIIVLNALDGVQVGALCGFEAWKSVARTGVIRSIIALPVTIISIWLWGLSGAVLSLAATGVLNLLLNQYALRNECKKYGVIISLKGAKSEWHSFLTFSGPALLGALLGAPVLWITHAMLVNQPNGYAEMGLYAAANQWKTAIMFIPRKFVSVALPMMSAVSNVKNSSQHKDIFDLTHSLSIIAAVPLVAFLAFASPWIVSLYGEDFSDAKIILIGVLLATGIASLGSGVGPAIQAEGRMWFGLFANLIWSAIYVLLAWVFVPHFGATALVFSMAIATSITVLHQTYHIRGTLPEGAFAATTKSMALLSIVFALAVSADEELSVVLATPIAVATLAVSFFFLISPPARLVLLASLSSRIRFFRSRT